ncbi:MAG: hypothetical protein SV760_05535, partial [Halobacteria archaeon]|nr:hypothetical protein [Halobacteria archaeon]
PGEILEGLGEFFDEPPANVYVIYVSETKTVKQENLLRDEVSEKLAARTKVETAEPQNLTEIGMRLQTMTDAYQESESENLVTCYDSVNYLLQYVDSTETAFK